MDNAAQVAANMNAGVLKEPRGFIRVIQLIIAIFAFATTTSFGGSSAFTITCNGTQTQEYSFKFYYPFKLNQISLTVGNCDGTTVTGGPYGDFSAPAQFYVFVGVMAFLYCIGLLVLYIFFDDKYRKFDIIPIVDFVASVVFVLLWLISSSAWAQGVSDVKYYTDPKDIFLRPLAPICGSATGNTCTATGHGPFAGLNVSIIFGFLNMLVWGASLWFLWKETRWFKANQQPETMPQSPSQEPQRI